MNDIHCPACNRLLAKQQVDGSFIIQYRDRYTITIKVGEVTCVKCSHTISVGAIVPRISSTWGSRVT